MFEVYKNVYKLYTNHKHLTGYTEKKTTYVRSYPFSQILSHIICPATTLKILYYKP